MNMAPSTSFGVCLRPKIFNTGEKYYPIQEKNYLRDSEANKDILMWELSYNIYIYI